MQALTLLLPTTWLALCIGHEAINQQDRLPGSLEKKQSWGVLGSPQLWGVQILPRVVSRGDLTPGKAPHCLQAWTDSAPPQGDGRPRALALAPGDLGSSRFYLPPDLPPGTHFRDYC